MRGILFEVINVNTFFMKEAIKEAEKAAILGEVPIGAVIVKNGIIIGRGHNTRESEEVALGHAEINAIMDASAKLGSWRLTGCSIYVTIEPCPMCAGALYQARVNDIYYGASDPKAGACGSVFDLFSVEGLNHYCHVVPGILSDECKSLLQLFFRKRR